MQEKFWYLKNCPIFERLTDEQIRDLESVSQVRSFDRGSLIYMPAEPGEAVFLVIAGRVKLYHLTPDGKQTLLALIEPGEMFGELAVFDGDQREEFAEAMLASKILRIPRQSVQDLMSQHADVAVGVTKLMGFRRQRFERRLKSLLFRSNRERLVHLLLELADQYGVRTPEGVRLKIKLSHQDMASIIGSTRETVTVVLGELQSEGLVAIERRQVILRQMERMARLLNVAVPNVPEDSPFIDRTTRPARYGT